MKKDIQKKWYDVRVECQLPATLTFRVFAEDENEAVQQIKNMQPHGVKYRLIGRKDIKLVVYDAGGSIIRLVKNLIGILR